MQLHKDLREFVELLNSNEVDYVVSLAFGRLLRAPARISAAGRADRQSADNVARVLKACSQFGFGKLPIDAGDLQTEGKGRATSVYTPNRIDLITR